VTETNASPDSRLTLITRVGCSHCEDARRDLQRLGAEFECVDVDEDAELLQRYNDWVPVLLLDGTELARAPLTEQTLRLAVDLSRAEP
jgi:glutaredoxin